MITAKENWLRAVEFHGPEWIPVSVGFAPVVWRTYREALEEVLLRHPVLFPGFQASSIDFEAPYSPVYRGGEYCRDNWGCLWYNVQEGLEGQVVESPLADWKALDSYRPPDPLTQMERGSRDWDAIAAAVAERKAQGHLTWGDGERLFDRLYFLRGFENLMMDIKPMFTEIFQMCRRAGTHVSLSSDGCLLEIVDDLIECGVSVHDPQVRANTINGIAQAYKGRLCAHVDLDRQMFPFCTPDDIWQQVEEVVTKVGSPQGGLMLMAQVYGADVPLANIEALCAAMEHFRGAVG